MTAILNVKLDSAAPCIRQSTSSSSPARNIHPEFASPDADVILRSEEGTLFCVHSHMLRSNSGLFRTMFTLPQPVNNVETQNEPAEIPIYETDAVTAPLLLLLCGLQVHLHPSYSYDDIERVLFVAEKWDTPGAVAYIRDVLMTPRFLNLHPLRLYALARHFEWDDETRIAATLTLGLDLHDEMYKETLNRLTAKELMPLLKLRRARSEKFRDLLNSPERFAAGNRSRYKFVAEIVTDISLACFLVPGIFAANAA